MSLDSKQLNYVEISCNRGLFKVWLSQGLITQWKLGNIIIANDITFYKGKNIRKILEKTGYKLWYIPPESLDLNKTENW